jgi:hypothetical protein
VFAAVAFENSSLHASDPLGTLAVMFWLLTVLLLSPVATAIAFNVPLEVTRNGAMYWIDAVVGVLLSVV